MPNGSCDIAVTASHFLRSRRPLSTDDKSASKPTSRPPGFIHRRFDSCMSTITNETAVRATAQKNDGRMPSTLTPPKAVTSHVAIIGPAMPRRPAATVSQTIMPVARSRLTRRYPRFVSVGRWSRSPASRRSWQPWSPSSAGLCHKSGMRAQ